MYSTLRYKESSIHPRYIGISSPLCLSVVISPYNVLTFYNTFCYALCNVNLRTLRKVHTEVPVTISCKLRLLLARVNVERIKEGKPALSLRRLAQESGVSLSVLAALHTGKSQRIDYATIDHLLIYFNRYLKVTIADLLTWEQPQEADIHVN